MRVLTGVVLGALVAVGALRLEVTSSMAHFLPSGGDSELAALSLEVANSALARRLVLCIGGSEARNRVAAALARGLSGHPEVAWVETGLDEDARRALYELYFPRRFYFAADEPAIGIPRLVTPAALAARAEALKRELVGPSGPLVSRSAPEDPLGLFDAQLARMRGGDEALGVEDGVFTTRDGRYAIVLLATTGSPFDASQQGPLLDEIHAEFDRLAAAEGGGLVLEIGGVHPIAVASERSIRADVNRISIVSVLGVCGLFLLVFRSLRQLLLALLAPLFGFAAAVAAATFAAPAIHSVTLGFGLALIGVSIDYPIHVLNHHALAADARDAIARIRPSLLLSAFTTALSFTVLALSDFPGLADMGVFAAVGVTGALLATLFALPAFLPEEQRPSGFQRAASRRLAAAAEQLVARPRLAAAVPAALLLVALAGVPRVAWQDDPGALSNADPALVAEDRAVRQRIQDAGGEHLVIAEADDPQAALALNDRVAVRLRRARADGDLEGLRSAHAFLWSEALQRENLAALRALPSLSQRIDGAFAEAGFRPGAFAGFAAALAAPEAPPLRPADLAGSPLERALDAALVPLGERWAALTTLRGVRSADGVRAALADLPGVHYVDQQQVLREAYAGYRHTTLELVALGAGAVLLVLLARYRRPVTALLAFVPSALVALATLGLLALLGVGINVVVAISLVIVMGMGVDYGVFAVDAGRAPERVGATLLSLVVSCVTTIFVFGVLALSGEPALRAIGLTTGIGVSLALLSAPAVMVLVGRLGAR